MGIAGQQRTNLDAKYKEANFSLRKSIEKEGVQARKHTTR
jgi:hypothetical protein